MMVLIIIISEGTLGGDELASLNDCLLLFNYLCKLSANCYDAELEMYVNYYNH